MKLSPKIMGRIVSDQVYAEVVAFIEKRDGYTPSEKLVNELVYAGSETVRNDYARISRATSDRGME